MAETIYVADDEKNTRDLIETFLVRDGYSVVTFSSGDELLAACDSQMPDLAVLDIIMPGTDGLSVCSTLRRKSERLPIIIVSCKDSAYDRVTGLTLGCDDYMVKPFLPLELSARIRTLLRRSSLPAASPEKPESKSLYYGPLTLHTDMHTALLNGEPLALTPTEFDFLTYLVKNNGAAVSREDLLKDLWHVNWQSDTRATDDMVKRLRRKLRAKNSSVQIETVWGYGFRLTKSDES